MDTQDMIKEVIKQIKKDPKMLEKFRTDPTGVVETYFGADLEDGMMQHVVAGVKAKLAKKEAGGLLGKLKKKL